MKSLLKKSERGFTLIEMLVAVVLFGFIVALAMGIFFRSLRIQRETLALMAANENAQSALEQMARELRTSLSFSIPGGATIGDALVIQNALNIKVTYRWNTSNKTVEREEAGGTAVAITGSNVKVERLRFAIGGGTLAAPIPRVTTAIKVAPALPTIETISTNMQMTISPR